jgi:hypothetical protein
MRKLVESTFMSLDGVISAPQEWSPPYWNEEHADYAQKLLFAADALFPGTQDLRGLRRGLAGQVRQRLHRPDQQPPQARRVDQPAGDDLERNRHSRGRGRGGREAEGGARSGSPEVRVPASSTARSSSRPGRRIPLLLFPVAVGRGERLFDGFDLTTLRLQDTTTFSTGIVVLVYSL